ncbi:MAG: cytochrome b/b6 domain-containing protein [Alphaproteobacteria bacterium]|nr:cytochrome b/b6 domain-containing protein [Alphaproteobacteria bacterium]
MTELAEDVSGRKRYTAVAIALHWLIAFSIIGMIALGWIMGDMPDGADRFALFQLHKSIGITILLLSVARIVWRLMNPPPPEPPMPGWQGALATAVHVSFYVLMIAMPLTGWALVSSSPTGIGTTLFNMIPWPHLPGLPDLSLQTKEDLHEPLEFVHSKLAWVIIGLLGLHLAGALKHQFLDRDGLISRMAPGLFGRTEGPSARGRGAPYAFGAALLLFIVGAAAAQLGASRAGASPQSADAVSSSTAPFWTVDPATSSIVFTGAYMGRPFKGRFAAWTSTIQFDPDRPEDARIRIVIPTGSATTGESYYDENMKEGDWFNVSQHPEAVFEVNEGVSKEGPTDFEATGVLTIKGVEHPVRLPFTLAIEGATARMHAETTLQRLVLGIGGDTLAEPKGDEEWVADEVSLVIDVVATRE